MARARGLVLLSECVEPIEVLFSNGAAVSYISEQAAIKLGLCMTVASDPITLKTLIRNASPMTCTHTVSIDLVLGSFRHVVIAQIVPGNRSDLVLGMDWFRKYNPDIHFRDMKVLITGSNGVKHSIQMKERDGSDTELFIPTVFVVPNDTATQSEMSDSIFSDTATPKDISQENQITIRSTKAHFACNECDGRMFKTKEHLLQHCRTAKVHSNAWCEHCEWLAISPKALDAYHDKPPGHWVCAICNAHETNKGVLIAHMSSKHSHCYHCKINFGNYYQHRMYHHHECNFCDKTFNSTNEVLMHQQVHQPREEKCYGCDRYFKTTSGIMIHLESGKCESGVTRSDIDAWAWQLYDSHQYVNDYDDDLRYRCPDCNCGLRTVSSLFQHAECHSCNADCDDDLRGLQESIETNVQSQASRRATLYYDSDSDW